MIDEYQRLKIDLVVCRNTIRQLRKENEFLKTLVDTKINQTHSVNGCWKCNSTNIENSGFCISCGVYQ